MMIQFAANASKTLGHRICPETHATGHSTDSLFLCPKGIQCLVKTTFP